MRALPRRRRVRLTTGLVGAAIVLGAPLVMAGPAGAAPAALGRAALTSNVTFIGDSVTAGFGFCGIAENPSVASCGVNDEMSDAWVAGTAPLRDCAPPSPPAMLTDACSNDNDNGAPWLAPAWTNSPGVPRIAYPFQIAAGQSPAGAATVRDWAVSGATPANWDPDTGGAYGGELRRLKDQYVVLTLGGNPLLGYFTNVDFGVPGLNTIGKCVKDTGYRGFFSNVAYPVARATGCLQRNWDALSQTRHLEDVYEALLAQGDKVLVVGYYRGCPWSFGFWQTASLLRGPSYGQSCTSQSAEIQGGSRQLTQWQQAKAVASDLNTLIHQAVTGAQDWAKTRYPGTATYQNLAWTEPDQAAWTDHQGWSADPWVIKNDTWIHPDSAGAGQLAGTVEAAMCANFGHWCGTPPTWGA